MEIFGSQLKMGSPWKVLYPQKIGVDESFLKQAQEWGYNAIVLENASALAKDYGFKVILKVNFNDAIFPFENNYKKRMKNFIDSLEPADALFWHSPYFERDCRKHLLEHSKLKVELLLEELQTLESVTPLFYSIPNGLLTKHFTQLEDSTGPHSFLVFAQESPYWSIRSEKSLPILEGLCEEVPLLLSETGRLLQNLKPGAFILVDRLMTEISYAACHLEAASNALAGSITFEGWSREWLKRHRPEIGDERHLFRALAGFAEKAQVFKAIQAGAPIGLDELKMQVDSLTVEMKLFYYHLNQKNLSIGKFYSEVTSYLEGLKELSQKVMQKF